MSNTIRKTLRRFARAERGVFAVLFAIAVIPLLLLLGIGLDYYTAVSLKSRFDGAADAAALSAVNAMQNYIETNGSTQTGSVLNQGAIAAAQAQALKVFMANLGPAAANLSANPTITPTINGTTLNATVAFAGIATLHFGELIGFSSLSIPGSASASLTMTTYIDFYIVIDTSQSMGIGSTATDMQNLYNRTESIGYSGDGLTGCVFGCHDASPSSDAYTNEQVAHGQYYVASPNPTLNPNPYSYITLRIDAARTAVQNIVAQAQSLSSTTGNIRIGLYTMQENPNNHTLLTTVISPTNNWTQLNAALTAIDLGSNSAAGIGDSNMTSSLSSFDTLLPSNGSGMTSATPENFVMIVSDGVQDIPGSCTDGHCTSVLPTSACTSIKLNATVGVIYTTYLPIYNNNSAASGYAGVYNDLVLPFASQIQPNLQGCASNTSYFFQATDGPALIAAMQSLFTSFAMQERLTN